MKLGDKITVGGVEWTVRAFTAAEHQRFDELAAEHNLTGKAARLETLQLARHGTARQAVLQAETKRLRNQLQKHLDKNGDLKRGLTEEQRLDALAKAAELDEYEARIENIRLEPYAALLTADEELHRAREAVMVAFMHEITAPKVNLADFYAALTDDEAAQLAELVRLGKLPAGLTARDRLTRAALNQLSKTREQPGVASA